MKYKYDLRQVDAWNSEEGWNYNETFHIDDIEIGEGDEKRAFSRAFKKHGIVCKRGMCRWENIDGSIFELVNRKTQEPLIVVVPMF